VAEGIAIGERAAQEAREKLAAFSVSEAEYERQRARRSPSPPPVVDFVRIENRSRLGDELIRARLTIKEGEPLNSEQLRRDIGLIYGLDAFESVRYEILQEDGSTGVVIKAVEKSWGPDYLQFGLELTDNFEGSSSYNLAVSLLRMAINPLNGEIRLAAQIGQDPGLFAEWHQPLDAASRYFTSLRTSLGQQSFTQYNTEGDAIADFRVEAVGFDLAAGREFGTWGEARAGYRFSTGDVDVQVGDPILQSHEFDLAQLYVRLSDDRFDNAYFPRAGGKGAAEYAWARESFGSDNDFDQLRLRYSLPYSWGRNTVVAAARYETTIDGVAPIESQFRAGGFLQLSGCSSRDTSRGS
jgi:NTE family protein